MIFPVSRIGCYRYKCDDFGTIVCSGADFFEPVEDFCAGCRISAVGRVNEDGSRVPGFFEAISVG